MRPDSSLDQAEGLRRLLVGNQMRVVTVAAGKAGIGRTSVTVNLAAALARSGKDVLVLDENPLPNNLPGQLRLPSRYDLLDVIQAKCSLNDAVLQGKGYSVLPAAYAMRAMQNLENVERKRLGEALAELDAVTDVMLVDAAMPVLTDLSAVRPGYQPKTFWPGTRKAMAESAVMNQTEGQPARDAASSGLAMGASLLVVTDATASGITASYALIKRMALENACLRFGIIVNKAGGEREAENVFDNMAKVARRNLAAQLDYLGHIPFDSKFARATQLGKPVVEAFPAAHSAQSCMALARELFYLPVSQDERGGGIAQMAQGQIRQVRNCRVNAGGNMLTM